MKRKRKRILISWLAYNEDFLPQAPGQELEVNPEGPNISMHRYFPNRNYELHVILHTHRPNSQARAQLVRTWMVRNGRFPIELRQVLLDEADLIAFQVIKAKITVIMMDYKQDEVDIFMSPGTKTMYAVWLSEHINSYGNTQLLQMRPGRHTKSGEPEIVPINGLNEDTGRTAVASARLLHRDDVNWKGFIIPEALQPTYTMAKRIAREDVTALILGPSGSGKEILAQFIVDHSPRKDKPFKAVNCAALNNELLSDDLFGHKKGAFTGADEDRKGYFENCNGGTLFLDEIGDITPFMQQSLLRVLQEGTFTPKGSDKSVEVDVRIIAATNRNLIEDCDAGRFRWDLYYRLAVVELNLPPLTDWDAQGLEELLNYFIEKKGQQLNKRKPLEIPKSIRKILLGYPFPGNIREMENLIARLYVLSDGRVKHADLSPQIRSPKNLHPYTLKQVEKAHIAYILERNDNNKTQTARVLGCSVNTLKKKIKEYNIPVLLPG